MALSQFLLSATLMVLGTPPLHHHFPHPGPVCAEHRLGFALSPEVSAGSEIGESWLLDGMAIGFADVLIQHEAPTVVLLEAGPSSFDLSRQLFSSDVPSSWTPVRYGPLTVEVRLVTMAEMVESLEHVHLLLDNRPLEPRRHALPAEPPRMLENGLLQVTYRYSLPCPPPGRHILQARYKLAGVWSHLSMPLRFDVRLPEPPQIIAISDGDGHPVPIRSGQMLSITSPSLKLQLAQVNHNVRLVAYLNDKPIIVPNPESSCCRTVPLEGHITPGVHRLTVRTVHVDGNCTITSEPSNEVVFHYYDDNVYLLRPGRNCNNRQTPSRKACQPAEAGGGEDGIERPLPPLPDRATPTFAPPENAAAGVGDGVFRTVSFAEMGDDTRGNSLGSHLAFVALFQPDAPAEAKQLLDTAVALNALVAKAASETEQTVEAAELQGNLATRAAREAEAARDAARAARDLSESKRNEVHRAFLALDDYSAPTAADARKRAHDQWETLEDTLRQAVAAAQAAHEHAATAADHARQASELAALPKNAVEAAHAARSQAQKELENARILVARMEEGELDDAAVATTLGNLRRIRQTLESLRTGAGEQRDRAQGWLRTATDHRRAAQSAKASGAEVQTSAETLHELASSAAAKVREAVMVAGEADARSLLSEITIAHDATVAAVARATAAAAEADHHAQATEAGLHDAKRINEALAQYHLTAGTMVRDIETVTSPLARETASLRQEVTAVWQELVKVVNQAATSYATERDCAERARAHANAATAASQSAAVAANDAETAATNAANCFRRIGDLYRAVDFPAVSAARVELRTHHKIAQDRCRTAQDQQKVTENHHQSAAEARRLAEKERSTIEQARKTSGAAIQRIASALDQARKAQSAVPTATSAASNAASAFKNAEATRDQVQQARRTAEHHASVVAELRAAAETLKQRIDSDTDDASAAAALSHQYAEDLARCGDTAEARVAQRHARDAAMARDAAIERAAATARIVQTVFDLAADFSLASQQAGVHAEAAEQAIARAARAHTMTHGARVEAADLLNAGEWRRAIAKADEAKSHAEQVIQATATAGEHAAGVRAAVQKTEASLAKMRTAKDELAPLQKAVEARVADAAANAQAAGTVRRLESEGAAAWDRAIAESIHQRLERRKTAATEASEQPVDVRLAEFDAHSAEMLADQEEAKAHARIRQGQAEARHERASAVQGPPSPFYFAAPAHFPIRGFGAGGEVIERPGAVIYEDMVFSFDRGGNYHLRFSILIPDLPTTLHLQLQLQSYPHGPWYTITLPPQQFRPEDSSSGRPQPRLIQDHIIQGRSEILHRCYGEMGKDATIRRTGSARFGYGFDAMRQAAAR